MPCCENCFADTWLKQYVRDNATDRGDCSYCETPDTPRTPVADLSHLFQPMLGLCHELTSDTVDLATRIRCVSRTRSSTWSRTINPFAESEETLFWEVEVADLLILFGEELAQPVQNDEDPQEYRTTQQLCTAVSNAGFDGILYGSTRRHDGVNLVLFERATGEILKSWLEPARA